MSWLLKFAQQYSVDIGGKRLSLDESGISTLIKRKLLQTKTVQNLFRMFKVPLQNLNELEIKIGPLKNLYAETDIKSMRLNVSMFEKSDFFEKYFFVICHEIVHFLARQSEHLNKCKKPFEKEEHDDYFTDWEERLGMAASIAYELESGSDEDLIWGRVYPKINCHFGDDEMSRSFFRKLVQKSKEILGSAV